MVLDSLNFYLSEKLFISPSILNEILARHINLDCRFSPFSTLNASCHSLLACRFSAERSPIKHMGFPLYVTCCFSLAAFNVPSLCLVFVSLISMCLHMFLLLFILYGTLCLLGLIDHFLFHVGLIFNSNLFKNFLILFLFLFFFWDPYNLNVSAFDIVPEVSETTSVLFILFTVFCSSEVISTILCSSSLIHSYVSDILLFISSRVFF